MLYLQKIREHEGNCSDFLFRNHKRKHIFQTELSFTQRQETERLAIIVVNQVTFLILFYYVCRYPYNCIRI
jgi:hypothetical protein